MGRGKMGEFGFEGEDREKFFKMAMGAQHDIAV
jgi:hypothetical protein